MVNCDFCDRLCGTSIEPAYEFTSGYIFCLHCVIEHVEDIVAGGDLQVASWSSDEDCESAPDTAASESELDPSASESETDLAFSESEPDPARSASEPEPEPVPEERSPKRRRLIGKQSGV